MREVEDGVGGVLGAGWVVEVAILGYCDWSGSL